MSWYSLGVWYKEWKTRTQFISVMCAGVCFCSSTCVSVCIIAPLTGFGMFFFSWYKGFRFEAKKVRRTMRTGVLRSWGNIHSSKWLPSRDNQLPHQWCPRQKPKQANGSVSVVPRKDVIILLPYLGLQSHKISKRLKSCIYQFYPFVNLRIIFQNACRLKSLFPYKDRLNRSQRSKVI